MIRLVLIKQIVYDLSTHVVKQKVSHMLPQIFLPIGAPKRERKPDSAGDTQIVSWETRKAAMRARTRIVSERYKELLELIQNQLLMRQYSLMSQPFLGCWKGSTIDRQNVFDLYEEIICNKENFEPQGDGQLIGYEYGQRLDLSALRGVALGYAAIYEDDVNSKNLDHAYESQISGMLANNVQAFLPLVDAMRRAQNVDANHSSFQINFRFQKIRHNAANEFHMDNQEYPLYADNGTNLTLWNDAKTRALATAACVRVDDLVGYHDCGTQILAGVPILKSTALQSVFKSLQSSLFVSGKCSDVPKLQKKLTDRITMATERAIRAFVTKHGPYALETAGVKTLTLENGVIADYNDFMFHKASADIPDGYSRMFFVILPGAVDRFGKPISFRSDATLLHFNSLKGEEEELKLMFTGI